MKLPPKRPLALLLALALLSALAACQPRPSRYVQGLVTELQISAEGELTSFLVRTESGDQVGVLLTGRTHASPSGSGTWSLPELRKAFQAELTADTEVSAYCFTGRKSLTTPDGQTFSAYEAENIVITGRLVRGGAALRDGTVLDVLESAYNSNDRTYCLPNGVRLLRVSSPFGPANSYVMGQESLDDLSETARNRVLAYYEERGVLYDEKAELERAYALQSAKGDSFRCLQVDQTVSPSASSERVMYFLTSLTLPADDHGDDCTSYELRLGDAFDRETGERLPTWDLFACSREEVFSALWDNAGTTDPLLRAEMEAAFAPERIVVFPESISVNFERGSLPSQEHDYILSIRLSDHPGLMWDWAVPTA